MVINVTRKNEFLIEGYDFIVKYNFDEIINRENTDCIKYDFRKHYFGTDDVIPMWVADMDFKTPDFILNAIKQRINHPVMGYSFRSNGYHNAVLNWLQSRHQWTIKKEWITFSPGVVPGLTLAVTIFTKPGDKIIVQPPVYFPFYSSIEGPGRKVIHNPLRLENGRYYFDFEDLKQKIDKRTKILILCSPHNPGGMVWKKEELEQLANICLENDILILSDEIHSDLIFRPNKHIPLASMTEEIAQNVITYMSPSKTFNMAALSTAYVIIPNSHLKKEYDYILEYNHLHIGNAFGNIALEAAYTHGNDWLEQMLDYVEDNVEFVADFFRNKIPMVKILPPEGTYLIWIDFTNTGLSHAKIKELLIYKAKVGLNDGATFGFGGDGFFRMNVACPRTTVKESLYRIYKALNNSNL